MASIADTFTRANSATTINPASDGGSWTVDAGTWGITSNQGYTVNATGGTVINGHLIVRRDADGPIQDFTITNARASNDGASGLWVNYDPVTQSGYMLLFDSTNTFGTLSRVDSGALGSPSTSVTFTTWTGSTAVLRMTSDGAGTIKVYQGGTLKATLTDTTGSPPPNKGTWVGFSTNASSTPFGTDKWTAATGTGISPSPTQRGWVVGQIGWGAPRTVIFDNFDFTDNSALSATSDGTAIWAILRGPWEHLTNQAHATSITPGTTGNVAAITTSSADGTVQATLATTQVSIAFRISDNNNFYAAFSNSLFKVVAGTFTNILGYTVTPPATISVALAGSLITVYNGATALGHVTDAAFSTNQHGIHSQRALSTDLINDWSWTSP